MAASQPDTTGGMSTRTLAYAIIPLIAVFILSIICLFLYRRRRRRLHPEAPYMFGRERILTPGGHLVYSAGGRRNRHGRWAPWSGTRSSEGLNELGEAPPPYKKDEDLENGRRPPEYLTERGTGLPTRPEAVMLRDMEGQRPEIAHMGTQTQGPTLVDRGISLSPSAATAMSSNPQDGQVTSPSDLVEEHLEMARSGHASISANGTTPVQSAPGTSAPEEIGESSGQSRAR